MRWYVLLTIAILACSGDKSTDKPANQNSTAKPAANKQPAKVGNGQPGASTKAKPTPKAQQAVAAKPPAHVRPLKEPPLPSGVAMRLGSAAFRHPLTITAAAITSDGAMIASSDGSSVRVWRTSDATVLKRWPITHCNRVRFSSDGTRLLTFEEDGFIQQWDTKTFKLVKKLQVMDKYPVFTTTSKDPEGHTNYRLSHVSRDGKIAVAVHESMAMHLIDVDGMRVIRKLNVEANQHVESTLLSEDGRYFAIRYSFANYAEIKREFKEYKYGVQLWDVSANKRVFQMWVPSPSKSATLKFAGDKLFITLKDGVQELSISEKKHVTTHKQPPWAKATQTPPPSSPWDGWRGVTSGDGKTVVGYRGTFLQVWDVATRAAYFPRETMSTVDAVAFTPDEKHVATWSTDKVLRLWSIETQQVIKRQPFAKAQTAAFSADGDTLVVAVGDKVVAFDVLAGKQISSFSGHKKSVRAVAASNDGTLFASWGYDGFRIWKSDGTQTYENPKLAVSTMHFAPDNSWLALSTNVIRVVNPADGKVIKLHYGDNDFVISADGKTAIVGKAAREPKSGKRQGSVALTGDAKAISFDGTLIVDQKTNYGPKWYALRVVAPGKPKPVLSLPRKFKAEPKTAISKDNKRLAVAEGGFVSVWKLP